MMYSRMNSNGSSGRTRTSSCRPPFRIDGAINFSRTPASSSGTAATGAAATGAAAIGAAASGAAATGAATTGAAAESSVSKSLGLNSAQFCFSLPWGHGLHSAPLLSPQSRNHWGCTPRSSVSACRGGTGYTPRSSVSTCRGGTGCSPRTCFSPCRGDTASFPSLPVSRRVALPLRARRYALSQERSRCFCG